MLDINGLGNFLTNPLSVIRQMGREINELETRISNLEQIVTQMQHNEKRESIHAWRKGGIGV